MEVLATPFLKSRISLFLNLTHHGFLLRRHVIHLIGIDILELRIVIVLVKVLLLLLNDWLHKVVFLRCETLEENWLPSERAIWTHRR